MIVVRKCFDPSIAGFYGETASKAFRCEHFVPIGLAVCLSFFQKEWTVAEQFATVRASEALGMEVLANGIQTITLYNLPTHI